MAIDPSTLVQPRQLGGYSIPKATGLGAGGWVPSVGQIADIIDDRPLPSFFSSATILPIIVGTGNVSFKVQTGSKQVAMHTIADSAGTQSNVAAGASEFAVVGLGDFVGISITAVSGTVTAVYFAFNFFNGARPGSGSDIGTVAQGAKGTAGWLVTPVDGSAAALFPTAAALADGLVAPTATQLEALNGMFNGDSFDLQRLGDIFKEVQASASGSTALWAPPGGEKFNILGYRIQIGADATIAAGGTLTINLLDGAVAIPGTKTVVRVPAGVGFGSLYDSGFVPLGGQQAKGFRSALANNTLNVNLSAALSGGTVQVFAVGTEE